MKKKKPKLVKLRPKSITQKMNEKWGRINAPGDRRPIRKNRQGDQTRKRIGGKVVMIRELVKQNGITRPSPSWHDGTPKITYKVWEVADQLSKEFGRPVKRKELFRYFAKWNKENPNFAVTVSVFGNEFYRWRKFNGIHGRVTKSGKVVMSKGRKRKENTGPRPKVVKAPAVVSEQPEFAFTALPNPEPVETPAPVVQVPAVSPEPAPVTPAKRPGKPPLPPAKPALPFPVKSPPLPWSK
jgi:hypothetical protein